MTGSLVHLGGDRWKVRVYAGLDPTGKQRIRSKTFRAPNPQRAARAAPGVIKALQDDIKDERDRADTIAGLAAEWIQLKKDRGKSPSTIVNYQRHADRITAKFGKMQVVDLTGRHIDQWYAELKRKGMSDANILHHHASLRGMLRQAERYGMVGQVATRASTPPERIRPKLAVPTTSAVAVMMTSAKGDLAAALYVLAATGARRGELVGLQWADLTDGTLTISRSVLTLKGGGWIVKSTKGKKERAVKLDPFTLEVLAAHHASVTRRAAALGVVSPWVFPNFRGDPKGRTPRRPGWLSAEWGKLRAKHGAATFRLHGLRHWHASVLIRRGVPITEISERIGHAQTSTTLDVYGHLLPDDAGTSAAAIGAELALDRT